MNAADFQSGHDRRHNDPPNLWLAVLAGSLAVHLLLLLSGRLFLFRVNSQKSAGVAAPIELVDISPKSSNKTTRSTRSSASNVITAPAVAQRAVSSETAPQNAAPIQPSIVQSPIPKPTPQIKPSIRPTINPSKPSIAAATPKPQPFPSVNPLPLTTPFPQPPTQPAPAPTTTAAPTQPLVEPTSAPPPAQSGNPLPDPELGRVPGKPMQGTGGWSQPNLDLPKVGGADSRRGTDVKADLLNIQDGNGGATIPDKLAHPIESSRLFSTLNYPAEIELNLGQTIRLKVLVDRTGKHPKVARVLESSRSQEYDKFVSDLIEKQWTFDPATSGGQPVESLLDISVQLSSLVR
ncbi:MAG: hypothetical protein LH702_25295 [Phormidesmis sp. CAN_BIN44]|nr:hypothetical protein [Phormidesmis sp. CAN_BIN44]